MSSPPPAEKLPLRDTTTMAKLPTRTMVKSRTKVPPKSPLEIWIKTGHGCTQTISENSVAIAIAIAVDSAMLPLEWTFAA
jgi:hypothetical protein